MNRKDLSQKLFELAACAEAREWARDAKGTTAQMYANCRRGDWLLWLAAKAGVDRKVVTLAACAVARTALKHVPEGELRPLQAIEAAEAWARGEPGATLEKVQEAANSASNAYYAAYAAAHATAAAASNAAFAAIAASDAAYCASNAYYAANASYYAASYASNTASNASNAAIAAIAASDAAEASYKGAKSRSLAQSAKIVRKFITWKMMVQVMKSELDNLKRKV